MSHFVTPETIRLELPGADWLLVKRRLSAGEYRAMLRRMSTLNGDGTYHVDPLETGIARMVAYLVDWSFPEYPIRGKTHVDVYAACDQLDPDDFELVKEAVAAHEAAMTAERERQKKVLGGATASPSISPSPAAATGATNGFAT